MGNVQSKMYYDIPETGQGLYQNHDHRYALLIDKIIMIQDFIRGTQSLL